MSRLVVPLTSLAALIVVALLLVPNGAIGDERRLTTPSAADEYHFGSDAEIDRPVHGSVQVYGGNASVRNIIDGDLIVLGGDATIEEGGRINGNIVYGGGRVSGLEGNVGGHVYSLTTMRGAAATISKQAVVISLFFVWLVAAVVVTLVSGREVRLSSIEVRASALHCFALGLVAVTSFVLTAIVFSYLVPFLVGIPLIAALAVFALLTKIYGMIAVFHAIGTLVAGSRTREQLAARKWLRGDLAMVVVGALLLGALRMIPVIGTLVWTCASVFGIGVALATKFGRREPWFLAWRPAEA